MKEFSELIKNIDMLRRLIREFFVFGYKSRAEFGEKSGKTYDNDRRRIQNYFDEYFYGAKDKYGKRNSILIDSDRAGENPLYRLYKSKSFTANDLILHFLILDTFRELKSATAMEFSEYIASEYGVADLDLGTVRLKLNEYVELGVLKSARKGNMMLYFLDDFNADAFFNVDFISFYSEIAPLGVIGSFIMDRIPQANVSVIKYKHRLLYSALDSYYLLRTLDAIKNRELLNILTRVYGVDVVATVLPLRILLNPQNGREYAACYDMEKDSFSNCRLDQIVTMESAGTGYDEQQFQQLLQTVNTRLQQSWNVNFYHHEKPQRIELVVHVEDNEQFILTRLKREGHGGSVEYIGNQMYRYRHAVYDPSEAVPWLKSFIGRIVSVWIEDEEWNTRLHNDIWKLIEGGLP